MVPGEGEKRPWAGGWALIRPSMAWPRPPISSSSAWDHVSCSSLAARTGSYTKPSPVTISVTGCSTWRRVFISRNQNRSWSRRNSTVPTPV